MFPACFPPALLTSNPFCKKIFDAFTGHWFPDTLSFDPLPPGICPYLWAFADTDRVIRGWSPVRRPSRIVLLKRLYLQQLKRFGTVAFANSLATYLRNTLMLIGYIRVSKLDRQDTRAQVKALKDGGVQAHFPRKRFRWSLGST
jgi:hypothetical protein